MGYISEDFLKDFATRQKGYIDDRVEPVSNALGLEDIPVFSPTKTYSIGDFVLYEGKLYKFEVNHKGVWDDDDAVQTTLYDEVDELGKVANEQIVVILSINDEDDVPVFNVNNSYENGDFIKYNDKLYRFITDHNAGNWDSSEVVAGLSGISISFNVEGESVSREIFSDENGKASTIVNKGLLVNITVSGLKDYYTPEPIDIRASLSKRNVYVTYLKNPTNSYENVTIYFKYPSSDANPSKANTISVWYDNIEHVISVDNDVATFNVPKGKVYRIVFPDVQDDYKTPAAILWTAEKTYRTHTVFYTFVSLGLRYIKYNGEEVAINDITIDDKPDIAGIIVDSPECKPFIIPTPVNVEQKQWGTRAPVPSLQAYASHDIAILDIDGLYNSQKIEEFYDTQLKTNNMVKYARTYSTIIGGVEKKGFVGSFGQCYQMYLLRTNIYQLFDFLQYTPPNITNPVWTSTQGIVGQEVFYGGCCVNGTFNKNYKDYLNYVIPFIEY